VSIEKAVAAVASKFVYREDPKGRIDPWFVMRDNGGKLYGDCDDFAITCLYKHFGLWGFIWHVCITHKAQIHWLKTVNSGYHVCGVVDGQWFDNWTLEAMPRRQFYEATGHTFIKRYYVWNFGIKLVAGLFKR